MHSTRKYLLLTSLLMLALVMVVGCGKKQTADNQQQSTMADTTAPVASLQTQLDSMTSQFTEKAPPDVVETFNQGVEDVVNSGILSRVPQVGDTALDFTLPNAQGNSVHLYSLLKNGPVVLTWYRGGWCPYCNLQLHVLQEDLPRIKQLGGQLVAVSPQLPDSSLSTVERHNLQFEVLSDVGNKVAKNYGIVYKQSPDVNKIFEARGMNWQAWYGNKDYELPLPVTFVIDRHGVIRYAFANADYRVRAEPADILAALRSISHTS